MGSNGEFTAYLRVNGWPEPKIKAPPGQGRHGREFYYSVGRCQFTTIAIVSAWKLDLEGHLLGKTLPIRAGLLRASPAICRFASSNTALVAATLPKEPVVLVTQSESPSVCAA
jgi:hypothetical protein